MLLRKRLKKPATESQNTERDVSRWEGEGGSTEAAPERASPSEKRPFVRLVGKAEPQNASARLSQSKDRILSKWEEQVRRIIVPARNQDRPALRNSLPEVLDEIAETLADPDPGRALSAEEKRLAAGHGKHRALNADYSLDQVIAEYHILRGVLFDVLEERDQQLSRQERDLIWDVLFISIKNAAAEFTQIRDEQKESVERRLDVANASLKEALGEKSAETVAKDQLLKTIFERVEDYALFSLDADGKITSWANGAQKIKQYTREEVIGRHYSMLYPKEGKLRNEPDKHLQTAKTEGRFRGEGLRQKKDGSCFLADVFITPMYEGDKLIGFFKIVADLTERNRVIQERDLTRTRVESLELESELRERFVFTLSHDLKNPLTAAQISSQAIARESCNVDRHRDLAQRAFYNVSQVDRMVTNLLDASRVRAGQPYPLSIQECDLVQVIRQVEEDLGTVYGDRFRAEVPSSVVGFWDENGLRRALENLCVNGVKYGDPLGKVTVTAQEVEDRVLLKVHNLGSPISSEDQESLFDLFHRSDSALKGKNKGWGLGLTLVRGITEAHGGVVTLRSLPTEGTTFVLDLPRDGRKSASR